MVQYDGRILRQFAEMLYAKARNIIITYAITGFILGGVIGLVMRAYVTLGRDLSSLGTVISWAPALLGLAIGISHGRMKAFMLRLEAQRTLCQVQIEVNTRAIEDLGKPDERAPLQKG